MRRLRPSHPGLEFSGVGAGQVLSRLFAHPYATTKAKARRPASIQTRRTEPDLPDRHVKSKTTAGRRSTPPTLHSSEVVRLAGTKKKFCHQLSRNSSGGRTFAEPISLSSTDPVDFRLPATALTIGFVLLASRTRRRQDTKVRSKALQGVETQKVRSLQTFLFSTFPQLSAQPVDNPFPG